MGTLERARHSEIVQRISILRKRFDRIYLRWQALNKERLDLRRELETLAEEQANLEQGQMIFLSDAS